MHEVLSSRKYNSSDDYVAKLRDEIYIELMGIKEMRKLRPMAWEFMNIPFIHCI